MCLLLVAGLRGLRVVEVSTERHQDVGYEERHVVGERLDAGAQAEHAGVPRRAARRHACRSGDGTHYMQA